MRKIRVFIAGHKGMVGSAILRFLDKQKIEIITKEKKELDLSVQDEVMHFFEKEKIDQVYLAAAKVGGIYANNTYPAEFIYQNLMIQSNVIHGAFTSGIKKILFLGSSCIYPKNADQPIKEEELLKGMLEPTNEPYAVAKIAGIKMCESYNLQYGKSHGIDYRCIMPTNLYGPGDNYHPDNSHVIPGLIYRFHNAKINSKPEVVIWGDGTPLREFLYVDDLARASIFIMNLNRDTYYKNIPYKSNHINVGSGQEVTIKELAELLKKIVGYTGAITFNTKKPNGNLRKLLNSRRIQKLGFVHNFNLEEGLKLTYENFLKNHENI
jgi:GDP-L-fucose synthase